MTYKDQLQRPEWQRKRLEIMERDEWTCCLCNSKTNQLNVHHLYYDNELRLWEYDDEVMVTVCASCHKNIHKDLNKIFGLVAFEVIKNGMDINYISDVLNIDVRIKDKGKLVDDLEKIIRSHGIRMVDEHDESEETLTKCARIYLKNSVKFHNEEFCASDNRLNASLYLFCVYYSILLPDTIYFVVRRDVLYLRYYMYCDEVDIMKDNWSDLLLFLSLLGYHFADLLYEEVDS